MKKEIHLCKCTSFTYYRDVPQLILTCKNTLKCDTIPSRSQLGDCLILAAISVDAWWNCLQDAIILLRNVRRSFFIRIIFVFCREYFCRLLVKVGHSKNKILAFFPLTLENLEKKPQDLLRICLDHPCILLRAVTIANSN